MTSTAFTSPTTTSTPSGSPTPAEELAETTHLILERLEDFQAIWRREHKQWPRVSQECIKRLALAGLCDPLSDEPTPPQQLVLNGANLRETIQVAGLVSRQRAQLLVLRWLMGRGELPPLSKLRLYANEAVTGFAEYLRERCPGLRWSEYLPDPDHPLRGVVPHRDLRNLDLPPASMQCLICNEVLEHLEELIPALESMATVLTLGGYLLATVPMAYGQHDSIVKALWRGEGQEPELLMEAEWHGDPVAPDRGSLVYRIPGWELLEQLRAAGFRSARVHALRSARYGVLGAEMPYVLVVVAKR
jgi:SAM-dependent methyltransferase